jgi:hypothetical protein
MKKTFYFCLALLFTGIVFSTTAKAQNNNDFFGYYAIDGKAPAAFADIDTIHLAGSYGAEQKPPVHGLIRMKNGEGFPAAQARFKRQKHYLRIETGRRHQL